jgi:hypothetical protein
MRFRGDEEDGDMTILMAGILMAAALCVGPAKASTGQDAQPAASVASNFDQAQSSADQKGGRMINHAKGTFEVKTNPQKPDNKEAESAHFSRLSLDKQFHGDLEATSKGEMLGAMTEVKGSAGYVAMERVTGTLNGRKGSFVLQHSGTMTRGVSRMNVTVVPDSGTGELVGISGTMGIRIEAGEHFYDFEYQLGQ